MKKLAIVYLFCLLSGLPIPLCKAQLAVPVTDPTNTATGVIIKVIQDANELIRESILPFKENISKVTDFFKNAKSEVNVLFKNLDLVKGVLETKRKIDEEFLKTIRLVNQVEVLPQSRWKYRWQLAQLWYHSRDILSVFEVSSEDFKDGGKGSIMDDKDRIILLKKVHKALQTSYISIRLTKRRMLKQEQILKRQLKEIETFKSLFRTN